MPAFYCQNYCFYKKNVVMILFLDAKRLPAFILIYRHLLSFLSGGKFFRHLHRLPSYLNYLTLKNFFESILQQVFRQIITHINDLKWLLFYSYQLQLLACSQKAPQTFLFCVDLVILTLHIAYELRKRFDLCPCFFPKLQGKIISSIRCKAGDRIEGGLGSIRFTL